MASARAKQLLVYLHGFHLGTLTQGAHGHLRLVYTDDAPRFGIPLSFSMPLARREHEHTVVANYLWGLLPESERVLDRWAREFRVSPRNPFALLEHMGEECAGAVQFVAPGREEHIRQGDIQWLTADELAMRLAELRDTSATGRRHHDFGQFSLAGAQVKTALTLGADGRWGIPAGATPTTHIFKPALDGYDGHAQNEHFCMRLAAQNPPAPPRRDRPAVRLFRQGGAGTLRIVRRSRSRPRGRNPEAVRRRRGLPPGSRPSRRPDIRKRRPLSQAARRAGPTACSVSPTGRRMGCAILAAQFFGP